MNDQSPPQGTGQPDRPPRTMAREARRTQLIEATIRTLASRGYSRLTLTEVARSVGISHGLVLFHFETKEQLLAETLAYLAAEYRRNWTEALEAAGEDPVAQLRALIEADFDPAICTPDRLAAWCAFWGEAQSRPFYQDRCGANDAAYIARLEEICARLIGTEGRDPVRVARILRTCIEGIWLDLMTSPNGYDAAEGLATVRDCAALCFPGQLGRGAPAT